MQNENLGVFRKGNFQRIDNTFMVEGHSVLQEVEVVQEKFGKPDTDTFINELRDSIAGHALGFKLVNLDKHGFDCKLDQGRDIYLEVKSASFGAESWQATFNDTTLEKASAFKDEKLYLALAVWRNASDLLFICFGQSEALGEYLESKVLHFKKGNTVRSTQSLGLSRLVFEFGFKIYAVNKSRKDLLELLRLKNTAFNRLELESILEITDFEMIQ
jgi:hypothetical protein